MFPYVGNNLSPTSWKHLPLHTVHILPGLRPDLPPVHNDWFCNNPAHSDGIGGRPPRPTRRWGSEQENPKEKNGWKDFVLLNVAWYFYILGLQKREIVY